MAKIELEEFLGLAPAPKKVKLEDFLGIAPAPAASAPKIKLEDFLGVAPLPSPAKPLPYAPKAAPIPTAPTGNFATRALDRAKEAAAGTRPFPVDSGFEARARKLGEPRTLTGSNVGAGRFTPTDEEAAAAERKKMLDLANAAAANPMLPREIGDEWARQAGVSPEDIARRGAAQSPAAGIAGLLPPRPGQGVVTGYPAPPREIPVEQSPDLMERRRMLAEKAAAEAVPTMRESVNARLTGRAPVVEPRSAPEGAGIAPRNSYGTVGEREGTEGLDLNPIGLALGAADEAYRSGKGLPGLFVEAVTGKKRTDPDRGFLPPIEAPSVNIGRTVAGAPMAVSELLAEKALPVVDAIRNEGLAAGVNKVLGKDDRPYGNVYSDEGTKAKGDWWDTLADSLTNTPGELFGMAMVPVHGAVGAYNMAQNATRGDAPVKETWRGPVDAATGMAGGMVRDVAALALDPKKKLEEGLFSTVATAALFSAKLRDMWGVDTAPARIAEAAAPGRALSKEIGPLALERTKILGAARGAEKALAKADNAAANIGAQLDVAGPAAPETLRVQQAARAADAAKAAENVATTRKALETFDNEHKATLDKAYKDIEESYTKASQVGHSAMGLEILSRLPSYYATLGATALTDAIAIAAQRFYLNKPGQAGARWLLQRLTTRLPELAGIMREIGREGHERTTIATEAYRRLPPEKRPTIRKAMHMQHTLEEGGFYRPGSDYSRHIITNMDGSGWDFTPYGQKWLDEQQAKADAAAAEMEKATTPEAADLARARKLEAEDAIQGARAHVYDANLHGRPFSELSAALTQDKIDLGILDPEDAAMFEEARAANLEKATAAHETRVAKANAEFAKLAARYRIDTGANVRGVERIAERVIGRASQRQQTAARQADALTAGELAAQERRLAPKDRVTGPAGDDAALRTREAEVAAERTANRRLGTRIADVRMQAGRDIAALDKPYSEAVKGISTRAQRVIDRAEAARQKAVGDSLATLAAETYAIQAAPVPAGLPRVHWRQIIERDARQERMAETSSDVAMKAASSRPTLGPGTDLKDLRRSVMRAEEMPMRQREEQYNLTPDFGEEVARGLITEINDVGAYKLYRELANRYGITEDEWRAQRVVDAGVLNAKAARRGRPPAVDEVSALSKAMETDKRYLRVPSGPKDPNVPGSPPMYGDLAGKFIPEDLYFELVNLQAVKEEMASVFNRALTAIKVNKTVLNPVTHARNFWQNALLLAPMAGLSLLDPRDWGYFWDALKAITAREKPAQWKAMEAAGMFDSGFTQHEMALRVLDDVHSGFVDHVTGPMRGFAEGLNNLLGSVDVAASRAERIARKAEAGNIAKLREAQSKGPDAWLAERATMTLPTAGRMARQGLSKITEATRQAFLGNPGALYGVQDDLFRGALGLKLMAKGKSLDEAVKAGRDAFGNYADNPGFVQIVRAPVAPVLTREPTLRKSAGARAVFFIAGQPFIAYSAWAIPKVREWALKEPARAMMYTNLHESISRANLASIGLSEQDERDVIATGKPWEQGQVLLATLAPKIAKNERGEYNKVDAGYMSPVSTMIPNVDPMGSKGWQAFRRLQTGLGIGAGMIGQPIIDAVSGRDSFTGRPLITDGQRPGETAATVGSYLYRAFLPSWAPSLSDAATILSGEGLKGVELGSPSRWTGGSLWDQGMSAATGAPNYTGQERTLGEFTWNVGSGSKLTSASLLDNALSTVARLSDVLESADDEATRFKGGGRRTTDPGMNDDTRRAVAADYRDRVADRVGRLRDLFARLAENVGADEPVIVDLASRLESLQSIEDPWRYYRTSRRLINKYMQRLQSRAAQFREARARVMER